MITLIDNRADKAIAFERGTRFLKLRHERSDKRPDELVRISHEACAIQIELELIQQYDISIEELRAAVKFAHAIHKMMANRMGVSTIVLLNGLRCLPDGRSLSIWHYCRVRPS